MKSILRLTESWTKVLVLHEPVSKVKFWNPSARLTEVPERKRVYSCCRAQM